MLGRGRVWERSVTGWTEAEGEVGVGGSHKGDGATLLGTHRFNTLKLFPLLDLLQFAHIFQRLVLEVPSHRLHLVVRLQRRKRKRRKRRRKTYA